jgi:hypothetical protein
LKLDAISYDQDLVTMLYNHRSEFKFAKSLREISITASAPDEVDDTWFENLNEFLSIFTNLEKVSLYGMKIGENFVFLAEVLKKVKGVELSMNGIGPVMGMNLLNIIDLDKIEELDLGSNWLGFKGLVAMKER